MTRPPDRTPRSAKEWKALPELPMKALAREGETGSIYRVLKTGFYRARFAELEGIGLDSIPGDGMIPLPTVTVEEKEGESLYRLPDTLNEWAYDNVAVAASGTRLFPCDVEFGLLRGQPYAEFVVSPPQKLN